MDDSVNAIIEQLEAQSKYDRVHCPPSNPLDAKAAKAMRSMQSENALLLSALIEALPYVEMAEEDESYKNGVVAKVTRTMQSAINHATKDTTK